MHLHLEHLGEKHPFPPLRPRRIIPPRLPDCIKSRHRRNNNGQPRKEYKGSQDSRAREIRIGGNGCNATAILRYGMVGVDGGSILDGTRVGMILEEFWVEREEDGHGAVQRTSRVVAQRNGRNTICTTIGLLGFLAEMPTACMRRTERLF